MCILKVFCCTQYIRHESDPYFSPDPDMIHEMIGHIPMFADPIFADFVQEFGLLSLGASDEEIRLLGALFWFTFETGSVKEKNEIKAYGGAIASSLDECQVILSHFYFKIIIFTESYQYQQEIWNQTIKSNS